MQLKKYILLRAIYTSDHAVHMSPSPALAFLKENFLMKLRRRDACEKIVLYQVGVAFQRP